jgi:16S rRNA (cytidine1402-2'-O)-methyltransferase
VANDLTKMFEVVQRGTLSDLLLWCDQTELRGEFTVVIHGKDEGERMKGEG